MRLYISKIEAAETTVNYSYFSSEHTWGFVVSATYSFHINDVTGIDNDDTMQVGMEALEAAYAQPYIAAKIGTDEYKNGDLTNISFNENTGVDKLKGSVSIEERVRVEDDTVLSDITDLIPSPHDVSDFSETFSFSRSDNSYSYNREVSLSYKQDSGGDFLNKAYLFLKNIYLNNRPSFGYQEDGISEWGRVDSGFKPTIVETLDILEKKVSFTESLQTDRIETIGGLPFSKGETKTISLNQEGYTETAYSVSIKALSEPLESNITSGVSTTLQELITQNGEPISIEKGVAAQGGAATLSVSFTNDPRHSGTTNIDYSSSKTEDNEGFSRYTFDLTISSKGLNDATKFTRNKDYWKNNISLPYQKIPTLFPEITSGDLNEVSRNVSFRPFGNSITDNINFSNNPNYVDSGDGILKRSVVISDRKQVQRDVILPIYGDEEIIIPNEGKTLGSYSIKVGMVAIDSSTLVHDSLSYASGYAPVASDVYLLSQSTNLDPLKNSVSTNLTYNYFNE